MDSKKRTDERRRLYWMTLGRGVLCVFAAAIVRLNLEPAAALESLLPFVIIAAAFAVNLALLPLAWTRLAPRILVAAQIGLDVLFITALVYATGGAKSEFLLLYFGPILAAATTFSRTATVLAASLSTVGLLACAVSYAFSGPRPPQVSGVWLTRQSEPPASLAGMLAMQAAALHLVAFLASTLAMRIKRASIETEQILDTMTDGVVTVDRDEKVVFANSRARAILSASRGKPLAGLTLSQVAPDVVCASFRHVIAGGKPDVFDTEIGAARVPAQVVTLPLFDHAGDIRGANVVLHDITERRRLIEALRRADRLEATATTAASIAHEIRNPVAAIRGSAQELRKALGISGAEGALLDLVVRESDRLNRVLTDFLNFARIPKPQLAAFDLSELIEEVAAQVALSRPGSAPDVSVSVPPSLSVRGDSEQLRQVFLNVGMNGVDATSGRGPVVFQAQRVEGGVAVVVRDQGVGIDQSMAEKIFEPFFTTKTTGTGLGLSVARRIVEDHGGTIEVYTDRDNWTCVKVFLPVAEGKQVDRAVRSAA